MGRLASFASDWPTLSTLLDEALALPPHERPAWLDGLGGAAAAHRDALRGLLAQQPGIERAGFLETLPPLYASAAEPDDDVVAGRCIGAYRLIARIGDGGMATVWLAERADGLMSRRVALKLPLRAWGRGFAERLGREREILSTLEHEHIARLYDAGLDDQGRPFLAMEHVEGEPIDVFCRERRLGVRERLALLLQVMQAVSHAHARLVVHRDLKPANILVTAPGSVKLLDFGIAKLLEGDRSARSALTEHEGRALTLGYASPEQVRDEPLGVGSDVYSLGVVAFELLTGAKPYRLARGSAAEIEAAIATADPRRPSEAATAPDARRALRGELDAVLGRALEKDAADRYRSVDAFADDIQRYLRGLPVQARPHSAVYRARRFVGRHRLAAAMGSALLASIVAGAAVSLRQAQIARAEERRASTELDNQRAVRDLYMESLARLSTIGAEDPGRLARPGAVSSVLQETLHGMSGRFASRPDERAAQFEAAMLQLNFDNRFEESLQVGREYLALLEANGARPGKVILAYSSLGRSLFQLQRFDESEAMRRKGFRYAADVHDLDTERSRMIVGSDLGSVLTTRGKREEALAVLTSAGAEMARRFDHLHLRYVLLTRLGLYHLGFDDAAALGVMRQARAELAGASEGTAEDEAFVTTQLGQALLANGLAEQAESELLAALTKNRQRYRRDSRPAVRAFGAYVAAVARRDPERARALVVAERAALTTPPLALSPFADQQLRARRLEVEWLAGDAARARAADLPDAPSLITPAAVRDHEFVLVQTTRSLVQEGRGDEALAVARALREAWPDAGAPTSPWLRVATVLAEAQLAARRPADAAKTADDLLRLLQEQHAEAGSAWRTAASVRALAAARSGDAAAAGEWLRRLDAPLPAFPSAAEGADAELMRAEALVGIGRPREGAALARAVRSSLGSQHPSSPRLERAQRLSDVASSG